MFFMFAYNGVNVWMDSLSITWFLASCSTKLLCRKFHGKLNSYSVAFCWKMAYCMRCISVKFSGWHHCRRCVYEIFIYIFCFLSTCHPSDLLIVRRMCTHCIREFNKVFVESRFLPFWQFDVSIRVCACVCVCCMLDWDEVCYDIIGPGQNGITEAHIIIFVREILYSYIQSRRHFVVVVFWLKPCDARSNMKKIWDSNS